MTFTHYCLLGSSRDLALTELTTVLGRLGLSPLPTLDSHSSLVPLNLDSYDPNELIKLLGGVVKIYTVLAKLPSISIAQTILTDLQNHSHSQFCLQAYPEDGGSVSTQGLETEIKNLAKASAYRVSFRRLKSLTESAGILHPYQEFLVLRSSESDQVLILKTVAVQDIQHWTQKDYSRPRVMPQAGMLPPKISRQLINLALPQSLNSSIIVYDPFCGVGTVLVEALDLGLSAWGSDISPQAISSAQANLDWYRQYRPFAGDLNLFRANVLETSPLPPGSVDAVVAEGYLGPAQIMPVKIDDYVKGLTKFYLGALKRLRIILKPEARVVLALPAFVTETGQVKGLSRLIDSPDKLGYTQVQSPLWYFRPQAKVRRQIIIWQKSSVDIKYREVRN